MPQDTIDQQPTYVIFGLQCDPWPITQRSGCAVAVTVRSSLLGLQLEKPGRQVFWKSLFVEHEQVVAMSKEQAQLGDRPDDELDSERYFECVACQQPHPAGI